MLKYKNKILALVISLLFVSLPGIHAEDVSNGNVTIGDDSLNMTTETHNLNTADSWIQPIITVKKPGYYAWTAFGPVWFSDGKTTGSYWDSGGIVPGVSRLPCKEYRVPYIKGGAIELVWVPLTVNGSTNGEIKVQKVTFGEQNPNVYTIYDQSKDFEVTFD